LLLSLPHPPAPPPSLPSFPTRRSSDLPWTGTLHVGERMSACEPAYLDALASFQSWSAEQDREKAAAAMIPAERAKKQKFGRDHRDRKSTRLNSSHVKISYAVFCLKKKK